MAQANGKTDITQMSAAEIEEFLKQRKQEQAKLAALKGAEARKDVEAYCLKTHGLTLAQIWMAGWFSEPKTYKNPASGETYTYSGRGKVPAWLKGPNDKPNALYLVANGA